MGLKVVVPQTSLQREPLEQCRPYTAIRKHNNAREVIVLVYGTAVITGAGGITYVKRTDIESVAMQAVEDYIYDAFHNIQQMPVGSSFEFTVEMNDANL